MNLTVANNEISNASLSKSLKLINTTAANTDDTALRGMLNLLQADIYNNVYTRNRWKYDERTLPLTPLPADFNEWSGKQFKAVIDSLLNTVIQDNVSLHNIPLERYNNVVTIPKNSRAFFPTLFDFAALKALSIFSIINETPALTYRWTAHNCFMTAPVDRLSKSTQFGIKIFRLLSDYNINNTAARIYDEIHRIEWVNTALRYHRDDDNSFYDALIDLYQSVSDTPESALILCRIEPLCNTIDKKQNLFNLVNSYKSLFHESVYSADIDTILKRLMQKSVTVDFPAIVAPETSFNVDVKTQNSRETTIQLFTTTGEHNTPERLVATKKIVIDADGPFSTDTVVTFSIDKFGTYTIIPLYDGQKKNEKYYPLLSCSNLFGTTVATSGNHKILYVSDIITGKPIEGVNATAIYNNRPILPPVTTNCNGFANLPDYKKNYNLKLSKGEDQALPRLNVPGFYKSSKRLSSSVLTSLPVYHPGDSASWVAVVYSTENSVSHVAENRRVKMTLRDANYQVIDTISAVTDKFGRVNASVKLPTNGLTGNFSININCENKNIGHGSFMVSDYKLPTFSVEVTGIKQNLPEKGDVTITGKAVTYSGFPVADSKVTVTLENGSNRIWYYSDMLNFYSTNIETDTNGCFTLAVTNDMFADALYPEGIMRATFDVTSPTGETRTGYTMFYRGKPYTITINDNSSYDIEKPVKSPVSVVNSMGETHDIPLVCTILSGDSTV
ncbi:MAG: hypothetical protein NC311_18750, partial [Muribaculaceae bacterium]|nr:hypothetical protein [Muribaculaceae bacterium]